MAEPTAMHLGSFRAGYGPHLPTEAVAARTPERNRTEWEGALAPNTDDRVEESLPP